MKTRSPGTKKGKTRVPKARRPAVEPLEPRILYSADFSPELLSPALAAPDVEHRSLDPAGEFVQDAASSQAPRHEIVFVDAATPDRDKLLADLRAQSGAERDLEVVVLDAGKDGIQQISDALAG